MNHQNFPFAGYLLDAKEEEIIWIRGKAFVVKPATSEDIERVGKGYFSLDPIDTEKATVRE